MATKQEVRKIIEQEFRSRGYTETQIAAVMATAENESGFNPGAYNPDDVGKPAAGLTQWRGDRLEKLYAAAKEAGVSWQDAKFQAGFWANELETSEKKAGDRLKAATTAKEAADAMAKATRFAGYNDTSSSQYTSRAALTEKYAKAFSGTGFASSSSIDEGFVPDRKPTEMAATEAPEGDAWERLAAEIKKVAEDRYVGVRLRDGILVQVDLKNPDTYVLRAPGDDTAASGLGFPSYRDLASKSLVSSGFSAPELSTTPGAIDKLKADVTNQIIEQKTSQIASVFSNVFGVDVTGADLKGFFTESTAQPQAGPDTRSQADKWADSVSRSQGVARSLGMEFHPDAGMFEARPRGQQAAPQQIDQSFVPDRKPTTKTSSKAPAGRASVEAGTPSTPNSAFGAIQAGLMGLHGQYNQQQASTAPAPAGRAAVEAGAPSPSRPSATSVSPARGTTTFPGQDISWTDRFSGLTNQEMAANGFRGVGTAGYAQPAQQVDAGGLQSAALGGILGASVGTPGPSRQTEQAIEQSLGAFSAPTAQAAGIGSGALGSSMMGSIAAQLAAQQAPKQAAAAQPSPPGRIAAERSTMSPGVTRDASTGGYVGSSGARYSRDTVLSREAPYANSYADYRDKSDGGGTGSGGGGYGGGGGGYSSGGGKEK